MKAKRKTLFVIALLVLAGITSGYIANTYAKYASAIPTKQGTAQVAEWNFVKDNETQTIAIQLDETPDPKTLVNGKIAPGTKGSFNIALKNTSDTGVDYTIKLSSVDDATHKKPANLKICSDAACTEELTAANGQITGHLDAKSETTPTQSKDAKIYWVWDYEDAEAAAGENYDPVTDATNVLDTTDGTNHYDWTINVDIIGVQTKPTPATETPAA